MSVLINNKEKVLKEMIMKAQNCKNCKKDCPMKGEETRLYQFFSPCMEYEEADNGGMR